MGGMGQNLRQIDFSNEKLPPFEKNFYIEHPEVTKRSEAEAEAWRKVSASRTYLLYIHIYLYLLANTAGRRLSLSPPTHTG